MLEGWNNDRRSTLLFCKPENMQHKIGAMPDAKNASVVFASVSIIPYSSFPTFRIPMGCYWHQFMRVALAIWNGRISPVFDVARQVLILDLQDGREVSRHVETLPGTELRYQADRLAALAPQTLICGAISQPMAAMLAAHGVSVVPFTAGDVEEVIAAWLSGSLSDPALIMPGCCGQMRRCRGRRNVGKGGRGWRQLQNSVSKTQVRENEL